MTGLSAVEVTVGFGGLTALDGVSLAAEPATITGLIGPNGAGKSTMFNVLTGLIRPRRGQVLLDDADVTRARPHRRAKRGLARTFQQLELWGSLTVRENVLVAAELQRARFTGRGELLSHVDAVLAQLGLDEVAGAQADTLSTGSARLLEVARAVATRPRMLLLDEPSAGLDIAEMTKFGEVLKSVAADGVGVLLVEHDVGLVMDVCSDIFVLDFGQLIAHGPPDVVRADEHVISAYLGVPDDDGRSDPVGATGAVAGGAP